MKYPLIFLKGYELRAMKQILPGEPYAFPPPMDRVHADEDDMIKHQELKHLVYSLILIL